jgi:ATP-dependent Clp protease ATP-binding subunit ClpC
VRLQDELPDSPIARILTALNIVPETIRESVWQVLGPSPANAPASAVAPAAQSTTKNTRRFTDRTSIVFQLAHTAALQMGHAAIAPEHVLLAMLQEEGGVAGQVLNDLGLSATQVRAKILAEVPVADHRPSATDLSSECLNLMKLAGNEAEQMQSAFIGTEHVLLALVRLPPESLALRVLAAFNLTPEMIRHTVQRKLGDKS